MISSWTIGQWLFLFFFFFFGRVQCRTQRGLICSRTFFPRCSHEAGLAGRSTCLSPTRHFSFCFVCWLVTKYQLCPSPPNDGWASLYAEKQERRTGKPSGVCQLSMTAALLFPPEDQNNYKVYKIVKHIKIPEVEAGNKLHDFPTQRHQSPPLTVHLLPSALHRQTWLSSGGRQHGPRAHSSEREGGWWPCRQVNLGCTVKTWRWRGRPDTDEIHQKALKRQEASESSGLFFAAYEILFTRLMARQLGLRKLSI